MINISILDFLLLLGIGAWVTYFGLLWLIPSTKEEANDSVGVLEVLEGQQALYRSKFSSRYSNMY